MRKSMVVFATLWSLVLLAGASAALAQSQDERAIRALLDRGFQANSSVDEKVVKQALAEFSASAGPFFVPFTTSIASVAEMDAYITKMLPLISARSFAPTSPITLRVDKNLAWAAYTWHADLTFKDGTKRGFDGRATATFVREGKNWKFAHGHSSLAASLPPTAEAMTAEVQAILQGERNGWEAVKNKQPQALTDYFAEDASFFDETQAYRVKGKAEILNALESWLRQSELRAYQILDPQVQVLGDTALLTYYFTEAGVSGGKEYSTAGKISVVFVKQGNTWKAMHEHRSVNR